MKQILKDYDEIVELALDYGDELNAFNNKGEWKNDELRDKAYTLVYQNYEVDVD